MTGVIAAVGLVLVAQPRESEPGADLSSATGGAADPARTPTGPSTPAHRNLLIPSMPVQTDDQQLSPDEPEVAETVDEDNPYYHGTVELQTELIVPCDNGAGPADLGDPRCVARWTVFHVAAGLIELVDAQWVEPTLLDELSTTRTSAEEQPPTELLVLDSIGTPDQISPGRAEMEVIVERAWASGQLDHLFYQVTLFRGSQGTWSVAAIGQS